VTNIINGVKANNNPPIPDSEVKYFETPAAMDEWLLENTEKLQVGGVGCSS
jgi:hypothetical protein